VWERRIPCVEVEKALGLAGVEDIRIASYTVSLRAKQLEVLTKKGSREIPAKEFRKQLGWERMPSTMITTVTREGDSFVFEGKGYGHGVGMCQWSALQMAKAGMTYREILSTFYPGAALELYEDRRF
jgi:stage II sporulation protein D